MTHTLLCIWRLALLLAITGCNPSGQQLRSPPSPASTAMTTDLTIELGESGPAFAKRYPQLVRVQHQPAGLDFYKVEWQIRPRGVVRIEHGRHSFTVRDVMSTLSSQDLEEFKQEGLSEFVVSSGMSAPPPGLVSHDEARLRIYAAPESVTSRPRHRA